MADDINPDSIPFVPDAAVALIDTDSGKPKTAFHDWMQSLWSWMKTNVVNLSTKLTEVSQTAGDAAAAVVLEQNARAEADDALAEQIITVSASVGNATANGEIYFAAKAAPGGAAAAYGIYLTAGDYYAGLEIIAKTGGGSAIGLAASQFLFTDSGTAQQVFAYSSGVFVFQVPVVIRSATTGARTVISNSLIEVYDASNQLRVRIGVW